MRHARFVLLSLLGALACSAGTEPVDGSFVVLTVGGTVRTADGVPVSGASLAVWARVPGACTGAFADAHATSDTSGAFIETLGTWNVPREICVWIEVVPPAGSGLAADTVTVQPARLGFTDQVLTVDVILPALPES